MILRGWHVDGFGLWHDHRIDDLAPGLNLLYGPNEAGKSTLHAFVRGVLFGFPDGRSREPRYPPLRGGNHGGRLFAIAEGREIQIARSATRRKELTLTGPDGERLEPDLLRRLVGGADGALFRNVFAFGLDELASLDALDAEAAGLRIFDAGLQGAGVSVTALLEELGKRRREILSPRSGRIRQLVQELAEARRARAAAVERARGHGELLRRELALEEELRQLRCEREAERSAARRWERLVQCWPLEMRRRAARQVGPPVDEALVERHRALAAEVPLHADRRRRIEALREEVVSRRRELDQALAELGPGWSLDRVADVDRSAARKGRVAEARRAVEEAEGQLAAAGRERENLLRERDRLRAEEELLLREAGAVAPDREEIRRRRLALADLRGAVEARVAAERRLVEIEDRRGGPLAGRPILVALLFALAAAALFATGERVAAAVAGVAALLAGLGWTFLRSGADAARSRIERELAEAREREARAAAALGLPAPVGPAEIERQGLLLAEEERRRERIEERERQIEELRRRRAGVEAEERRAAAAVDAGERALAAARDRWRGETACFGGEVRPGEVERLFAELDRIAAIQRRAEAEARDLRRLEEEVARWEDAVATLLREAGETESGPVGLERLGARIEAWGHAREAELQIAEILGTGPEAEALRSELSTGDRERWEAERDRSVARAEELEARLAELLERRTLQRQEREALEASADVPACEERIAALESELRLAVRRYRETALLERLLGDSLERYRQERQPAVLRFAGEAFAAVTGGRYVAVRQQADASALEVVDAAGRVVPAGSLSRGTREQLYVCVRLALARSFAERGTRLPLLLDDVLVNFDPRRADAMASVLASFAAEQQVLLFTCHPATVERFLRVDPTCKVIELRPEARPAERVA